MDLEIITLAALGVLIVLVVVLLLRGRSGNIKDSLTGVNEAKDIISDHAVQTIKSISDLGENLHKLVQQQEEAQRLGQSLKDLLQAPKLRFWFHLAPAMHALQPGPAPRHP